jgi:hypothetical protein
VRGRARAGERGQAIVEALGTVPLLVAAVLVSVQLTVLVRAAVDAHHAAGLAARALPTSGPHAARAVVAAPSLLPGVSPMRVSARAVRRVP